jgi:hypothetical protein
VDPQVRRVGLARRAFELVAEEASDPHGQTRVPRRAAGHRDLRKRRVEDETVVAMRGSRVVDENASLAAIRPDVDRATVGRREPAVWRRGQRLAAGCCDEAGNHEHCKWSLTHGRSDLPPEIRKGLSAEDRLRPKAVERHEQRNELEGRIRALGL